MRPRLPSADSFSLTVGVVTAAVVVGALVVAPGVDVPVEEPLGALGVVVAISVWTALEQIPERVDATLRWRLHVASTGLLLLPILVAVGGRLTGLVSDVGPTATWAFVGLALGGILVGVVGEFRRVRTLADGVPIHAVVTAQQPRWQQLVYPLLGAVPTLAVMSYLLDGSVGVGSVVGFVLGTLAIVFFTGPETTELAAIDSGLLVRSEGGKPRSLVPWRRIRTVETDGGRLRVVCGLPVPRTYLADLSSRDDAREVADAIRRCRRRGVSG